MEQEHWRVTKVRDEGDECAKYEIMCEIILAKKKWQ